MSDLRENGADAQDVEDLVRGLNSLLDGEQVAAQLIACGPVAIPAVRSFLLLGKPGVVYQPRLRAVEVLGAVGAKDVLIEYITTKKGIPDPAVRMAEEVVENAAARELAKWRTQDVFDILIRFALPRSRSGIVEALGQFRKTEAIPYFVHALEDDFCRNAAEDALRALGRAVEVEFIAAARRALPSAEEERPSSLRRRRAALALLVELRPSDDSWPMLKPLMASSDPALTTSAVRIAVMLGSLEDRIAGVDCLLKVLPAADWYLRSEIQDCLSNLYDEGRSMIEAAIAERNAMPRAHQITDSVLRTLLAVRRRQGAG
jgi:hypothetical protein